MKFLTLLLFWPLNAFADCQWATNSSAEHIVQCEAVTARQSRRGATNQMIVELKKGLTLTLRTTSANPFDFNKYFAVNKGERTLSQLSAKDVLALEELRDFIEDHEKEKDMRLIYFFSNLPSDESLESLTTLSGEVPWPDAGLPNSSDDLEYNDIDVSRAFTPICQYVGKIRQARYFLGLQLFARKVRVGDPSTECFGRCGLGCNRKRQIYTQECLDHDLCHRETGQNLGVCKDHFWMAADGFVRGPSC